MRVYGPDGRVWTVSRRPEAEGPLGRVWPGRWLVEARTDHEARRWVAVSRRAAAHLADDVAMTLRTGAESPPGELSPESEDV